LALCQKRTLAPVQSSLRFVMAAVAGNNYSDTPKTGKPGYALAN
jgi:hypothetical protein